MFLFSINLKLAYKYFDTENSVYKLIAFFSNRIDIKQKYFD